MPFAVSGKTLRISRVQLWVGGTGKTLAGSIEGLGDFSGLRLLVQGNAVDFQVLQDFDVGMMILEGVEDQVLTFEFLCSW